MNKRIYYFFVGMIVCCFLMCGCNKKADEPVEIIMIHGWGSTGADHVAMRQIYEDFEKAHPEIKVKFVSMPSSTDVVNRVSDLLTIGEIPDIIFTGGEGRESVYKFMVEKGYAVDIMPYMEMDEMFAKDVSPLILESWTTERGSLYTVSDVLLLSGYWYNEEIFRDAGIKEVPDTWDAWFEMCEKVEALNEKNGTGIAPIVLDEDHVAYLTAALLTDEGADELQYIENSRINVHTNSFEQALNKLEQIALYARLEEGYHYLDTLSCFNAGESAVYINGIWANGMIDETLPVAYAAFPSEDGKGIAAQSACVGYILGNTKDEKRIAASMEFLKYMLSDEVAERILVETGQFPSNPNVELTDLNSSDRMRQAVDCIESADGIMETPANLWDLWGMEEYEENMILYLEGNITKDELFERIDKK